MFCLFIYLFYFWWTFCRVLFVLQRWALDFDHKKADFNIFYWPQYLNLSYQFLHVYCQVIDKCT